MLRIRRLRGVPRVAKNLKGEEGAAGSSGRSICLRASSLISVGSPLSREMRTSNGARRIVFPSPGCPGSGTGSFEEERHPHSRGRGGFQGQNGTARIVTPVPTARPATTRGCFSGIPGSDGGWEFSGETSSLFRHGEGGRMDGAEENRTSIASSVGHRSRSSIRTSCGYLLSLNVMCDEPPAVAAVAVYRDSAGGSV